jgi:hypothetical protein
MQKMRAVRTETSVQPSGNVKLLIEIDGSVHEWEAAFQE